MGILSLVKGILLFILGAEKIKSMLKWWESMPILAVRILAILLIAISALIVYSV